ncbi:MAG: hypothetical protein AAGD12_15850 [Pseudomonadota bacterium]
MSLTADPSGSLSIDNPTTAPIVNTLSFDADGLIDSGSSETLAPIQYDVGFFEYYLSLVLRGTGYHDQAASMEAWFPEATYHVGLSETVEVTTTVAPAYESNAGDASDRSAAVEPADSTSLLLIADNLIDTGRGRDVILDLAGDNVILAGGAADVVITGSGADVIGGGKGNDLIVSGAGDDYVEGQGGSDEILLGAGDDLARGGRGRDLMLGEAGEDWLWGNSGFDLLDGGTGDDRLEGGWGRDTFRFMDGTGHDVVADFRAGRDMIEIDHALGVADFEALLATASETTEGGVRFDLGPDDSVTLEGVSMALLDAGDFSFL